MTNRLHESQFFAGMAWGLHRRHYRLMSPSGDQTVNGDVAFHLSMEDAFEHLRHLVESGELDLNLRFRMYRDLHGFSPAVQKAVYHWTYIRLASYRERGAIEFTDRAGAFNTLLAGNPVEQSVWLMLVDELIENYLLPSSERQWIALRDHTKERALEAS